MGTSTNNSNGTGDNPDILQSAVEKARQYEAAAGPDPNMEHLYRVANLYATLAVAVEVRQARRDLKAHNLAMQLTGGI